MNDNKWFRFDLFIAVCALLVSSVAAGASAFQTYVINQQYQASIWPYLGFTFGSGGKQLSITAKNYGLGPALIHSYEVTVDGKPLSSLSAYVARFESKRDHATVDITNIGAGSVIPASESIPLLTVVNSANIVQAIVAHQQSIDISICYCSILGRCWLRSLQAPSHQPHDVRACPNVL